MTEKEQEQFKKQATDIMKKLQLQAMASAANAVSTVIYDIIKSTMRSANTRKVKNLSKTQLVEMVEQIKKYCEKGLGVNDNIKPSIEEIDKSIENRRAEMKQDIISDLPEEIQSAINPNITVVK